MPRKKEPAAPAGLGTSSSVNAFLAMKRTKTYDPAKRPAKTEPETAQKQKAGAQSRKTACKPEEEAAQRAHRTGGATAVQEPAQKHLAQEALPTPHAAAAAPSLSVEPPVSTVTTDSASPTAGPDAARPTSSADSHRVPAREDQINAGDAPAGGSVKSVDGCGTPSRGARGEESGEAKQAEGQKPSSSSRAEGSGEAQEAEGEKLEAAVPSGRVTRSQAKQLATAPAKRRRVEKSALVRAGGAGDSQPQPYSAAQSRVPRGRKKGRGHVEASKKVHASAAEEVGEAECSRASAPDQARAKEEPRAHELAPREPTLEETAMAGRPHQASGLEPGKTEEVPGVVEGVGEERVEEKRLQEERVEETDLAAAREARAREVLSQYPPIQINRAPVLVLWVAVVAEREGFSFEEGLSFGQAVAAMFAQSKGRRLGLYAEKEKEDIEEKEARRKAEGTTPIEVFGLHLQAKLGGDGMLEAHMGGHPVSSNAASKYVKKAFGEHLDPAADAMRLLALQFPSGEVGKCAYHLYEAFRPMVAGGVRGWGAKGQLHLGTVLQAGRFIP